MTTRIPVDRNRALRTAQERCSVLPSPSLGACTHTGDEVTTASIPEDYRLRHPIAVQEANQSVVIFVGRAPWRPFRRAARRRDGAGADLAA